MNAQPMGVLVGVDGSACAQEALIWAAADAAARETRLTVATVVELPQLADVPISSELMDTTARGGRQTVESAVALAKGIAPVAAAEGRVTTGNATAELLRMARDADEVVVGSRGSGGFAALLLGSVGCQVAAHATCPVVVVRGRATEGAPVVVGIDGSQHAEQALEYGFGYAERHGLALLALHAYAPDAYVYPMLPYPYPISAELARIHDDAARATEQIFLRWSAKYPDVQADWTVQEGTAAHQLVEASRNASLLVVGSRGHGQLAGMVLGSVSLTAVRHSHCPIAVVH